MKKRAIEAAVILAVMLLLFAVINAAAGAAEKNIRKIDGEYYNIGERSLSLVLMTEEGTDQLSEFSRLEELTVQPYKKAAANSVDMGSEEANAEVAKRAEYSYSDCTDLDSLGFLQPLTMLKTLDVSWCGVTELSFISGMSSLSRLNISHTRISDLSALSDMDSITELVIADIPAEDLSPLLEMDSLNTVSTDREISSDIADKLREKGVNVNIILPRSTEEEEQQKQSPEQ